MECDLLSSHGRCEKVRVNRLGVVLSACEFIDLMIPFRLPCARLYVHARLVHGDLSEFHILVCAAHLVDNSITSPSEDNAVQAVLIDFGFAVDTRHPSAKDLLKKDITKIRDFFAKQGTKTLGIQMAVEFVMSPEPAEEGDYCDGENDEDHNGPGGGRNKRHDGYDTDDDPMDEDQSMDYS